MDESKLEALIKRGKKAEEFLALLKEYDDDEHGKGRQEQMVKNLCSKYKGKKEITLSEEFSDTFLKQDKNDKDLYHLIFNGEKLYALRGFKEAMKMLIETTVGEVRYPTE